MSSFQGSFVFGSHSTSGVRDAFEAYRRSQRYLSDTVSASASATDDEWDDYDRESVIEDEPREDRDVEERLPHAVEYDPHAVVGNLQWDEDLTPGPSSAPTDTPSGPRQYVIPPRPARHDTEDTIVPRAASPRYPLAVSPRLAREDTPLLHKATSLTFAEPPRPSADNGVLPSIAMPVDGPPQTLVRRTSQVSARERRGSTGSRAAKAVQAGHSTFGQTLFNAIAILLGIGMLSEPLAFAYAGWIGGMFLMVFYGYITCYTAKILAHIILDDAKLRSYADIGRKAFGPRSSPLISALFCLELFTVSVALVTLYGDSLHAVLPVYSSNAYKILGLAVLVPTVLMPLSLLSYTSILGILSTLFLVAVMFIDGLSKKEAPGSLWEPAHTSLSFAGVGQLGLSFGLIMAGFSGHAVIPSLARDMIDPTQFDVMIDWAFAIATAIYTTIGVTGYLMFGNDVSDEFSQELMRIPGYNPVLNRIALWGLVIAPLSKFALATRPLNITLEIILGIEVNSASADDHGISSKTNSPHVGNDATPPSERRVALKRLFTIVERALFTVASVAVSILVPEFSSMMAFLGSFSAFLLCVIGPVSAKVALTGRWTFWDSLLLLVGTIMAAWGTGAAFWSAGEGGV
ncbi:amino acid transporter [Phanerochaete sordida]|uniref:Amino acid transporter n=1 Tax=Phanerochaete sordida TaxID=48140 RepID=A0A9P3L9J4_9APHY|nr:amino acid transporter [Phanerochaete sordida]